MNIIDLLNEFRIDHRTEGHEHCRSGWVQVDCPFCSPGSGRFRLGINITYMYANCWTCGARSLQAVLKSMLGAKWPDAKGLVQGLRPERREERPAHSGKYTEPKGVTGLLTPHKVYLRRRGFDPTDLERLWHIRSIGIAVELSWRIFIPIIRHGQAVSWTTRTIGKGAHGKYISAKPEQETVPHKHVLYGEDYCRHGIVVCEGPIDVWAVGPGAVATFGIDNLSEQVERISRYPVRAICYDNEKDAQRRAQELANRLSVLPGDTYNIVLDSKDPGEAQQKEIRRIRKEILK